jgi:hypothetical protein
MDLRSEGIAAHPIALENLTAEDWQDRIPASPGLVIVYDGQTRISEEIYGALCEIHPTRPVVFVRSRTTRFAPEFEKFYVVPLFEGQKFPHYQPHRKGRGGWADVVAFLGGGTRPKDKRRRGFAFLSYSSKDRTFIDEQLVPALEACDIGLFDYQFTERLDEKKLEQELERGIKRCSFVIAYISANWRSSKVTTLESSLAQKLGRPVVSIAHLDDAAALGFPTIPCKFMGELKSDVVALKEAIDKAIPG